MQKEKSPEEITWSCTSLDRTDVVALFDLLQDALELTRTQIMPTVNRQGRIKRKPIGREQFGQKVSRGVAVLKFCWSVFL